MNNREVRTLQTEIRALEAVEAGALRLGGYVARFNEVSEDLGGFRERVANGAFTQTLLADDIRGLFNHDANYVMGRNRAGTLRLREDDSGLLFEVDLPDTQWARDLHASVRRGDITQCSFGFDCLKDVWETQGGTEWRTLLEVKLYDVSVVTFPAYTGTSASARSIEDVLKDRRRKHPAQTSHREQLMALKEKEFKRKSQAQQNKNVGFIKPTFLL